MKRYIELVCASGGMIFAVLFGIGFVGIAQFVPPLDPSNTAEETAEIFRSDTNAIRTGLLVCYIACPFYLAFGAAINAQTRRIIDLPKSLVQLQAAAFSASLILIIGPFMLWWVAAFRPGEISPELTQTVNDMAWISFLIGWVPFVTWYVTTGLAILCDTTAAPVYPRWAGYVAVMMGMGQTSATFLMYFKTGPFAWDGIFAWWLPATWFFIFFMVMTVTTWQAINRQYGHDSDVVRSESPLPASSTL
ncbi:hypothetical protein [Sporichthya polymorpha]|uniref:hypothetical protein n=1 Tax=Sporichthya polymorpha TaxID=35751 RepID=UPI00035CB8B8|nr:hypothetical protein [Sporichthya polymorpha]